MCLVAHRAFTELFHSSRLADAVRTSSHDLQPASCLSFLLVVSSMTQTTVPPGFDTNIGGKLTINAYQAQRLALRSAAAT